MANQRLLWRAFNGDEMAEAWAVAHPTCWEVAVKVNGERLFTEVAHHNGDGDQPLEALAEASLADMQARGWTVTESRINADHRPAVDSRPVNRLQSLAESQAPQTARPMDAKQG